LPASSASAAEEAGRNHPRILDAATVAPEATTDVVTIETSWRVAPWPSSGKEAMTPALTDRIPVTSPYAKIGLSMAGLREMVRIGRPVVEPGITVASLSNRSRPAALEALGRDEATIPASVLQQSSVTAVDAG
jgi:hypothetical protein